jgi:hypothetical protein
MKGNKKFRFAALLYLLALLFFGWGVTAGHFKIFPWKYIESVSKELYAYFTFQEGPPKSVQDKIVLDHQEKRTKYDFSGFQRRDPDFDDRGYLLISRYNKKDKQVIVELLSIATAEVLHTWVPSQAEIYAQSQSLSTNMTEDPATFIVEHPLLLADGGLVFNTQQGPMVRVDGCANIVWVLERNFHHSIEVDSHGNLVSCVVLEGKGSDKAFPIRDDSIAIVSMNGEIIQEYSVTDILLKNGYSGLIYGVGRFEEDRIHLNDVQPILTATEIAEVGDMALSIRNLSTVALVQPQTGKIKWLKTGPWLNQHDVNPLGDDKYSIFGNDVVRGLKNGKPFAKLKDGKSEIYVYDQPADTISRPYSSMMAEEKIKTVKEGRSKILANGDVFIEQQGFARLLRISENEVRWEYVNKISPDTIGDIHWSRYISEEEIDLAWLESVKCQ